MQNSLLHFTGRGKCDCEAFDALKAICTSETLRLTKCPIFSREPFQSPISMVCFTDQHLSNCLNHTQIFGRFAVAFNKDKLIEYGANPVFYTTPKHYDKIKGQLSLLAKLKDQELDRSWKDEDEPFINSEDETYSLQIVSGFLQEYAYKQNIAKGGLNYDQSEWRILKDSLPFIGEDKEFLPGMSSVTFEDGKHFDILKFSPDDIDFIVIPMAYIVDGSKLSEQISKPFKILEEQLSL